MRSPFLRLAISVAAPLAIACSPSPRVAPAAPEDVAVRPPPSASAEVAPASASPLPSASASPSPLPSPSALPSASASPLPPASAPSPAPSARARPVRVANIGMHVGGGPYDDVTKEPIARSVAPHFAELGGCFPAAETKPVEIGVDLVIEAQGGIAQVFRPRTKSKDAAFVACVMAVFGRIEFLPPRNGKTVVSYSLRFAP